MALLRNIWPKLVIVEGTMGSGKSTTVLQIADRLETSGIPAIAMTEGVTPHPIRFDWDLPWSAMPRENLANSAVAKWRAYVNGALASDGVSGVDGQLFHGNLTSLLLLEADMDLISAYLREVVAAIKPLSPLLVCFRQDDIDKCDSRHCGGARRGMGAISARLEAQSTIRRQACPNRS
jgi:hypothetical protein